MSNFYYVTRVRRETLIVNSYYSSREVRGREGSIGLFVYDDYEFYLKVKSSS